MNRDTSGKATVRIVRIDEKLDIDGVLSEPVYERIRPMSGFTQAEPMDGAPATDDTDIWLFYDDKNLYIAARCWESRVDRIVANELRRDHNNIIQNDNIAFAFDTFYDRRSGIVFETTPIGARLDVQFAYTGQNNYDWNPVWKVNVTQFDKGWLVEASVPFTSLRYRPGREQLWGFNVRRSSRWRNEVTYLNPIPRSLGMSGIFNSQLAAPAVGLVAPAGTKRWEVKPFAVSNLTTDETVTPRRANDPGGAIGIDAKFAVTRNLSSDFTYNTDFAQVEADAQQVNLTRFSLFFPEKREFFLENQGLFFFGGGGGFGGDVPTMFYSRRIGLNAGRPVPIRAGARLNGRVGRYSLGVVTIGSGADEVARAPSTTFSVFRLKRDILRMSSLGLIYTGRTVSLNQRGASHSYGADSRLAFFDGLVVNAYWARTETPGVRSGNTSYRAQADFTGDRFGAVAERLVIGERFSPEVGFVRRPNMAKTFAMGRFSPRPKGNALVRRLPFIASTSMVHNMSGRLESRELYAEAGVDFQNSDHVEVGIARNFEFLPANFAIAPRVTLPVGEYEFTSVRAQYDFGRQRPLSGSASIQRGEFYNGHKTTLDVSGVRANFTAHFSMEPTLTLNWIDLQQGSFKTTLLGSRITYTMTPMSFVSAFLQYNSSNRSLSANVRLRWEYQLGSELFVVFNEQRDTGVRSFPGLQNRSFIVKINRLLRF